MINIDELYQPPKVVERLTTKEGGITSTGKANSTTKVKRTLG